jgi:hypothetical protein
MTQEFYLSLDERWAQVTGNVALGVRADTRQEVRVEVKTWISCVNRSRYSFALGALT